MQVRPQTMPLNAHAKVYIYSYNTVTSDMTKIYVYMQARVRIFCHIPSNRVITVILYTQ